MAALAPGAGAGLNPLGLVLCGSVELSDHGEGLGGVDVVRGTEAIPCDIVVFVVV